jgi:DNA-binding transcriptional LysR family regulator
MKVSPVDLNLLAVLDAILQTASVSRAAEQVGISKPAMSHALARLRAQLGDPVLVRAGQQWHLSERALALRERVHELATGARGVLDREPSFDPASSSREFRVHATDHVLALLGGDLGAALADQAPGCALRFLPIQTDDAAPLRGGLIDLAIGVFPDMPPEFRTQALFQEKFACVVRRGHPRVKGKLSLASFLALQHVLVAPRGRAGSTVDAALAERGLSRQVTRFVPYFVVALDLVSRTDGVLTVSERLALAYEDRFDLQVLRPPLALPTYTICQVWHPRVDADPSHRWFRQLVAGVARDLGGKPARRSRPAHQG